VSESVHWTTIAPADAAQIVLPRDDIVGPLTSMGEPCPWPWEPQQLVDVPMGQYHCGYCSEMVVAGIPHVDYRDAPDLGEIPPLAAPSPTFTCSQCHTVSTHPDDIANGYCGRCHAFTGAG
jgi:hypothetical protein